MLDIIKKANNKKMFDDDLKILRTWVEYSQDRKIAENLMYELEMEDETGEVIHLYKCVKFVRVIRLPHGAKQSTTMIRVHARMMQAIWQANIKFITVIANILTPIPFGLMYLYGVQGVAATEDEAKQCANMDYTTMVSLLQGTYRVLEYQPLSYQELEWLKDKMFSMKNLTVVRGIPKAKESGRKGQNPNDPGAGCGMKDTMDEDATTEEFIAGMSDKEYVVQILSTPVKAEHLERWLAQTAQEMTNFNKQLSGTSNIGFNLSIPMMYMANLGASEGWSHSYTESNTTSISISDSLQSDVSTSIGENVGQSFGETVGHNFGESFSESTGESYSSSIGTAEGTNWGDSITQDQGVSENYTEGVGTGSNYGESLSTGNAHNDSVSESVNDSVGTNTNVTQGLTQMWETR